MDREDIGVKFFFEKFEKEKHQFESLGKDKEHQKVTFKLYKTIILKFLTIYFYDVYFFNRPFYFFLGGNIRLNKCGNWIRKDRSKGSIGGLKKVRQTLGLYWYNRILYRHEFSFKLKKLTGSTNRLPQIEKEWMKSNDIDLLKTTWQLKEEGFKITNKEKICYQDYTLSQK